MKQPKIFVLFFCVFIVFFLEEAKRIMLAHSDYSLQAIAEECGYANSSNFSRAFKAQEGMTPGQWLTKQKENT